MLKPVELYDIKDCINYILNKKAGEYFQYSYHGITTRIAFSDIICFESSQHYTDIYTTDKIIKIKGMLKEIQEKCPVYFFRCQRSYIVNQNFIEKWLGARLLLKNNIIVDISPRQLQTVANIMKELGKD